MLHSAKTLKGFKIQAVDGEIGRVDNLFFDDEKWVLRYLVADLGNWLTERKVLVSPLAVKSIDLDQRRIETTLTKAQIEASPDIDTEMPVSRQHEIEIFRYYNWPYYWYGLGLWGVGDEPRVFSPAGQDPTVGLPVDLTPEGQEQNPHLRSTREAIGYRIHATDGEFGHIEDFLFDDRTFAIRYAVVDTVNWWPSKAVLMPTDWITRMLWSEQSIHVMLEKETIKAAPEFDKSRPVESAYESSLVRYYEEHTPSRPGLSRNAASQDDKARKII